MKKHRSYIRHWRKYRGLTQRQVIDRLQEIKDRDGSRERFPTTEASLSRVEAGGQNFNMALLTALAEVLEADAPGDLLVVNPFAGSLGIMRALDDLTPVQVDAAMKVIEAMRQGSPVTVNGERDSDESAS